MANRYWVGGSANWDATAGTKWSLTSGGAGGEAVPTTADDVFFDAASGAASANVSAPAACRNLNFSGYTGSFIGSSAMTIAGSLTVVPGMTFTYTGAITWAATGAATITTASKTLGTNQLMTFNGVGGVWQLQDDMVIGSGGYFAITNGRLDVNGHKVTSTYLSTNNSNARGIDWGTGGSVDITGNAAVVMEVSTATGFTFTGTGAINFTYSGSTGTRTIRFGNSGGGSEANAPNINITAGADAVNLESSSSFGSVNFTGSTPTLSNTVLSFYGSLTLTAGMTLTAGANAMTFAGTSGTKTITTAGKTIDNPITFNGIGSTWAFQDALTQGSTRAFTLTNGTVKLKNSVTTTVGAFATSGTNQKTLQSTVDGSQATLSQASGTVNASRLTIKDINATGGATWNALASNNNLNAGNNAGWDFGPAVGSRTALSLGLGLSL